MEKILDNIHDTEDIRRLNLVEKKQLAGEIREFIIQTVSKNGGHLASNLGVVELTIALHSIFDTPKDKIVWDVGHQTYTHKIITGRKEQFKSLRKTGGLAGFPKTTESEYDCFNTGHSSTSISAALGMAKARDIKKEDHNIIAVIGDGALTGGMALEALNDAGNSNTRFIVILNDNEMSISKNVGGISMFLSKLRTRTFYTSSNNKVKILVKKIPYMGDKIIQSVRKLKYSIKHLFIYNMLFEDIGFKYFGPIDGHDIEKLESILTIAKKTEGPVLIHVVTKKGKGYLPAEQNPDKFHGVGSFSIKTGKTEQEKKIDYSAVFGKKLVEMAKKDESIVAITAAMRDGTGLGEFSNRFPERFFDVGIAEQHAVCFAAGLATAGLKPIIPIYSSFYQRAYDQVIHDVCMQNLPVVMCSDRAGIVGKDGETHQGILDLSFCNIVPNLTIMAPKNFEELEEMLEFAVQLQAPVFLRYPRGKQADITFPKQEKIELAKAEMIQKGNDITIIAIGNMVAKAVEVANQLQEKAIQTEIINARFLKPFDEEMVRKSIEKTKHVITIEDNSVVGGLASKVKEVCITYNILDMNIQCFGYPDTYIKQGEISEIEKQYGLDVANIVTKIEGMIKKEKDE